MTTVKLTPGRIFADVSISRRVTRLFHFTPRPLVVGNDDKLGLYCSSKNLSELETWANKVFEEGERSDMSLENIASCFIIFAKAFHHSDEHINAILVKHDLHRRISYYTRSSKIGLFNPNAITIPKLKTLVERLSGLKRIDIMETDSTEELAQKAESNITEIVSRMSDSELSYCLKSLPTMQALLTSLSSKIEERRKKAIRR